MKKTKKILLVCDNTLAVKKGFFILVNYFYILIIKKFNIKVPFFS